MAIETAIKRLAVSVVPARLLYWLWHMRRRRRTRTTDGTAVDLEVFQVQEGVHLDVYWSKVGLGPGPSASLFVLGEEVLRLDCFEGETAHLHINPVQLNLALPWSVTPRQFFPPAPMPRQIERGVFELERNITSYLQMNQLARVREFPIDRDRLTAAAERMGSYMRELAAKHASQITRQKGE